MKIILNLLISLRQKFLSLNYDEKDIFFKKEIKNLEEEIEYYRKAFALKKENQKLKEKIKLLKSKIKERK